LATSSARNSPAASGWWPNRSTGRRMCHSPRAEGSTSSASTPTTTPAFACRSRCRTARTPRSARIRWTMPSGSVRRRWPGWACGPPGSAMWRPRASEAGGRAWPGSPGRWSGPALRSAASQPMWARAFPPVPDSRHRRPSKRRRRWARLASRRRTRSRAPHRLADGQYAARRAACGEAATRLGLASLREVADLGEALAELAGEPELARRVRQVVTEIERVERFAALLASGDLVRAGGGRAGSADGGGVCPEGLGAPGLRAGRARARRREGRLTLLGGSGPRGAGAAGHRARSTVTTRPRILAWWPGMGA
jgi:hypothetical protein